MRVIKGQLKLRYGIFYVHEMLELKPIDLDNCEKIIGYAIFSLQHQRIGRLFHFFNEIIAEVENLVKLSHMPKDLKVA